VSKKQRIILSVTVAWVLFVAFWAQSVNDVTPFFRNPDFYFITIVSIAVVAGLRQWYRWIQRGRAE